MTDDEILIDLCDKAYCKPKDGEAMQYCQYFRKKFFKTDDKVYRRRSFTDLHKYYRRFGVSEKQLMRVLGNKNNSFSCYVCDDTQEFMFFLLKKHYKCFYHNKWHFHALVKGKYTKEYLENLYDSCY